MASKRNRFTNLPEQFFNWINSHIESAMTSISNYFVTTIFHTVYKKMPCDLKNVNTMVVTRCTSFQEPSYLIFSSRELQVEFRFACAVYFLGVYSCSRKILART